LNVAFVLDKSGSMEHIGEAVVEGYNEYLRELREQGGETRFSLTVFDTRFHVRCVGEPLEAVSDLDHRRYRPGGMTALFDAIGHTVLETERRLDPEGRGGEKVLVVVMTDGLENSSTDYDAHAIAELVRSYDERPNWTFVYLGAGHDTIEEARDAASGMGYKAGNAMRWKADPASARKSMESLARATYQRRYSGARKSEQFFADANQSPSDYEDVEAAAPAKRRRVPLHRRRLDEALAPTRPKQG
jgi:hypothetical protein